MFVCVVDRVWLKVAEGERYDRSGGHVGMRYGCDRVLYITPHTILVICQLF